MTIFKSISQSNMNQNLQNTSSWFLKQGMVFFSSNDTTFQPINAYNDSLNVLVDKSIIETIIGRLLNDLESDEDDLNNAVNALSIFNYRNILMKERMLTPSSTWSPLGINYSSLWSSSTLGLDYLFGNAAMFFLTQSKWLGLHKFTESTWQKSLLTFNTCAPWHFRWYRIFWSLCGVFL